MPGYICYLWRVELSDTREGVSLCPAMDSHSKLQQDPFRARSSAPYTLLCTSSALLDQPLRVTTLFAVP